jgi:hypothetical protein
MPASTDGRWPAAWAGTVLVTAALCGCGPKASTAEVSGTVTLDNRPLAGVTVAFFPQAEGVDPHLVSRGTTDSEGRYTLVEPGGLTRAVVGTNRVIVLPPKTPRSPASPTPSPPGRLVPARYGSPRLSPLLVEVQAGGPQTIHLPLSSK